MKKIIILASFIQPNKIDWFKDYLVNKFDVKKSEIYGYENELDKEKILVVYKLNLSDSKINLKLHFPNSVQVNKKSNCIYSINGLNKLIESENVGLVTNNHKNFKIDWEKYQNNLILTNKQELSISAINRLF
jgi:hypothetical protein